MRQSSGFVVQRHEVETVVVLEIEIQDSDKHQRAARHRVEDELDRCVYPTFAAPNSYQQVHRDEHRLPEYKEQEQIECTENA